MVWSLYRLKLILVAKFYMGIFGGHPVPTGSGRWSRFKLVNSPKIAPKSAADIRGKYSFSSRTGCPYINLDDVLFLPFLCSDIDFLKFLWTLDIIKMAMASFFHYCFTLGGSWVQDVENDLVWQWWCDDSMVGMIWVRDFPIWWKLYVRPC